MKIFKPFIFFFATFAFFSASLASQEALKSTEEEYYDFLSLTGAAERPTLNYRTLSDSEWNVADDEKNIWKNNNLGTNRILFESSAENGNWFTRGIDQDVKLKVYGPEWFNSYNTKAPYGQNDGALWQGKGYNTSLTAGARLEAYGFEVTVKPQVSFSENREFDYIKPNYAATDSEGKSTIYNGKASDYGYYGVTSIDSPQRFGDDAFWTYDWGDTEARWSWHTFTAGFGTQSIWLGPAQLNPIIHSNNAATYPKFDIGIRKTAVYMPHFGWHLGDIEARGWWGKLTESDYFDNDDSNDNNLISGLAVAYKLPFTDLTVGLNRTMLSKWDDKDSYSLFHIYIPFDHAGGDDENDQRFSFTADWIFKSIGLEMYAEWGRNDYSPNMDYIIRYPFHTQGWTAGIRKTFTLTKELRGEILAEFSDLECSADYDRLIDWYTTFYAHHIITQGYTNRGQWLGAGIGTGGNSQFLGTKLYYKRGSFSVFVQRRNPDLDYTMYIDSRLNKGTSKAEKNIRAMLIYGIDSEFFIVRNFRLDTGVVLIDEHNPLNDNGHSLSEHRYNIALSLGTKYNF